MHATVICPRNAALDLNSLLAIHYVKKVFPHYILWVQREAQLTASPFLKDVIFGSYWLLMDWFASAGCSRALKTLCWITGRNLWHIFMEAEGLIFSLYRMFQLVRATGTVAPGMVSYFIAALLVNYFSVHTWRPG